MGEPEPCRDKAEQLVHTSGELAPLMGHSLLSAGVFQGVLFATQVRTPHSCLRTRPFATLVVVQNMKQSSPDASLSYADKHLLHDTMRAAAGGDAGEGVGKWTVGTGACHGRRRGRRGVCVHRAGLSGVR